jgi:hypothetical protein
MIEDIDVQIGCGQNIPSLGVEAPLLRFPLPVFQTIDAWSRAVFHSSLQADIGFTGNAGNTNLVFLSVALGYPVVPEFPSIVRLWVCRNPLKNSIVILLLHSETAVHSSIAPERR